MKQSRNPGSDSRSNRETQHLRAAIFEGRYDEAFQQARELRELHGEQTPPGVLYAGACALFGLGHILQAEEWVEAHGGLTMYRADHLYLAAYIELHKERPERALLYWTRIVQDDPSQTFADSLIEKLKKGEQRVRLELGQPGAFLRYVPLDSIENSIGADSAKSASGKSRGTGDPEQTRDRFWWLLAGIVFLSAMSIGFGVYLNEIVALFAPDPYAAIRESLPDAPVRGAVIRPDSYTDDSPRFMYPEKEAALAEYREAREKIGAGFPNQARYLLGRLELSNASFEIKERVLLLRDAIPRVGRSDFRDPLDIGTVLEEPYIYRDAQVSWQGRVQNIRRSEQGLRFDLVVPHNVPASSRQASDDNLAQAADGPEAAETEIESETETGPDRAGTVSVSVLYLYETADREQTSELEDGQTLQIFGSVVKASNGRITVHASDF